MYELSQEAFYNVKPLLQSGHPHPEILSIIACNNPGWIFVDQVKSPRSALVWSKGMQGFYLIGDHTNHAFVSVLDDYISSNITPRMRELGMDYFEVSGHHDKWNMESIFVSREIQQFEQLVFTRLHKPFVSENKQIKTINLRSHEWDNQELTNKEFAQNDLDLFWNSKEDFLQKGYGFAAIEGSEIIGICYSSFVTQDTHAIGVETLAPHQGKGVGTHLASLLVNEMIENGFTPYWDCSLNNEASKKLALRLGFQQTHQYKCSSFAI